MYPTTIGDLMAIADAGEVMPPKSTWFGQSLEAGYLFTNSPRGMRFMTKYGD